MTEEDLGNAARAASRVVRIAAERSSHTMVRQVSATIVQTPVVDLSAVQAMIHRLGNLLKMLRISQQVQSSAANRGCHSRSQSGPIAFQESPQVAVQ